MSFADDLRSVADFLDDHPDLAAAIQPSARVNLPLRTYCTGAPYAEREMAGIVAFLDGLDEMPEPSGIYGGSITLSRDFGEHAAYLQCTADLIATTPAPEPKPAVLLLDIDAIRAWKPDGPEVVVVSDRFGSDAA